ncbi:glycosyltransferase family 2 protein [Planctomicrobium sp. SH527]|uniref:glycosyltransferase family 2 protein n=1 Tax=Planctomicrobium sp. SH527 TaxID=3448123 RepID=UPI003F5B6EDF
MTNIDSVPISVIIPTYRRPDQLAETLKRLQQCRPQPAEFLVHIDAGDDVTRPMLQRDFPEVVIIDSPERRGPGGGRNHLVKHAQNEFIVSFDDDSWPLDPEFFLRAAHIFDQCPEFAMFACTILEADASPFHAAATDNTSINIRVQETSGFVGCGCFFRRSIFLRTGGYLPLENAYGMEEQDVAIKLVDSGFKIGLVKNLLVYHNCDRRTRHAQKKINAAQITNTALLAYLRYPVTSWPYGLAQTLNRLKYCLMQRRLSGMLQGVLNIPRTLWTHRTSRQPVRTQTIRELTRLRRQPQS